MDVGSLAVNNLPTKQHVEWERNAEPQSHSRMPPTKRSVISRGSASAALSSLPSSSKKVSDRIVKLFTINPESQRLEEIYACSTECEVSIAQEWLDKLPPQSYDEEYVLKRNSRARVLNKHSRLGCQVVLTPLLQGMVVAIPEPKPWDIP